MAVRRTGPPDLIAEPVAHIIDPLSARGHAQRETALTCQQSGRPTGKGRLEYIETPNQIHPGFIWRNGSVGGYAAIHWNTHRRASFGNDPIHLTFRWARKYNFI